MRASKIMILAIQLWAVAQGGIAIAEGGPKGEAPPLAQWSAAIKNAAGAFPHIVAFVTDLPEKGKGDPKFMPIDAASFNKLSYFQIADQVTADWDFKLNRGTLGALDPIDAVMKLTNADSIILAADSGSWKILRSADGHRKVLVVAKPPKSKKPSELVAWMINALGWDGVVLDQKGDFLLVGSTAEILAKPQIQALAVDSSADKFALRKKERKGAGLLSLSENKDGVGVFDIVFLGQGVKSLPVGTKLIIERKK